MEALFFVVIGLLGALAFWIYRMFTSAFDQPSQTHQKPFSPKPATSLEEMLRQHMPKTEEEIAERANPGRVKPMTVEKMEKRSLESDKPKYRSLEGLEPRIVSLEKLEPMARSQETLTGETVGQREDIVRRREFNAYKKKETEPVSRYAQILRNPKSAREAIILAEILKPKF